MDFFLVDPNDVQLVLDRALARPMPEFEDEEINADTALDTAVELAQLAREHLGQHKNEGAHMTPRAQCGLEFAIDAETALAEVWLKIHDRMK